MLIDFTIEMLHQGFPLDLKNLGKHALKIIQVCRPNFTKFGKNWVQQFMVKYGSRVLTQCVRVCL